MEKLFLYFLLAFVGISLLGGFFLIFLTIKKSMKRLRWRWRLNTLPAAERRKIQRLRSRRIEALPQFFSPEISTSTTGQHQNHSPNILSGSLPQAQAQTSAIEDPLPFPHPSHAPSASSLSLEKPQQSYANPSELLKKDFPDAQDTSNLTSKNVAFGKTYASYKNVATSKNPKLAVVTAKHRPRKEIRHLAAILEAGSALELQFFRSSLFKELSSRVLFSAINVDDFLDKASLSIYTELSGEASLPGHPTENTELFDSISSTQPKVFVRLYAPKPLHLKNSDAETVFELREISNSSTSSEFKEQNKHDVFLTEPAKFSLSYGPEAQFLNRGLPFLIHENDEAEKKLSLLLPLPETSFSEDAQLRPFLSASKQKPEAAWLSSGKHAGYVLEISKILPHSSRAEPSAKTTKSKIQLNEASLSMFFNEGFSFYSFLAFILAALKTRIDSYAGSPNKGVFFSTDYLEFLLSSYSLLYKQRPLLFPNELALFRIQGATLLPLTEKQLKVFYEKLLDSFKAHLLAAAINQENKAPANFINFYILSKTQPSDLGQSLLHFFNKELSFQIEKNKHEIKDEEEIWQLANVQPNLDQLSSMQSLDDLFSSKHASTDGLEIN